MRAARTLLPSLIFALAAGARPSTQHELGAAGRPAAPTNAELASSWPYRRAAQPTDAWLFWLPEGPHFATWTYTPLYATVGAALHAAGASVRLAEGYENRRPMMDDIGASVRSGRTPTVIVLAWWQPRCELFGKFPCVTEAWHTGDAFARELHDSGAHVVLYNSEPLTDASEWQGHHMQLDNLRRTAATYGASELWDYSLANLEHVGGRDWRSGGCAGLTLRFVPPAYTAHLDVLEDSDLESAQRNESAVGFVGARPPPPGLQEAWANREFWDFFVHELVYNRSGLRATVTAHPIQLSFARWYRTPAAASAFAFRIAPLLANRACVIATRAHQLEEAYYAGLVNFVDREHLVMARAELLQPGKAKGCQEEAYRVFRRQHDAARVLAESGFLRSDAWLRRRGSSQA